MIYGARVAVPWVIGTGGWSLFIVTPTGSFNLTGNRGVFHPEPVDPAAGDSLDFLVFDSRRPESLMREMSQLTGPAAMPPRWALGYMQSHRTLDDTQQILDVADTFRKKQLPCDAVIYLGTGFCKSGWNTGHGHFDFNPQIFGQNPAAIIRDLHDRHLRVVLHVVPPSFIPMRGKPPVSLGELADAGKAAEYWRRHLDVFNLGVDGWWPDEGDWYSVAERFARHRMYYEGPLSARADERPWNLQRNGYIGVARYGGWIWSGDVQSCWKTLAAQVPVGLNYSLTLSPYWGTDTGGFLVTPELTGELYVRWFQFSAFCPSFRSHGVDWQLRLPWGWNQGKAGRSESKIGFNPEPSELRNAAVEPICRDYLNLRYRLLPYTYTLAREAFDTGMPLMRALWLHYPEDREAARRGDEYLWGRDLLVAPVVQKQAVARELYLPKSDWYDWWTGEKVAGGRSLERAVDLKTMPLYVRAGAILPLDPVRQYTEEPVDAPTELRVYRGADGSYTLYEDDGHTLDYRKKTGVRTRFTWDDTARTFAIEPADKSEARSPRTFLLRVLPEDVQTRIDYQGAKIVRKVDLP